MPPEAVARRHVFEDQLRIEADLDFDESRFVWHGLHGWHTYYYIIILLLLLLLLLLLFKLLLSSGFFWRGLQGDQNVAQPLVRDGGADMEHGGADFIGADFIDRSDIDVFNAFGIVAQGARIDFVSDLHGIGRRLRRMAQVRRVALNPECLLRGSLRPGKHDQTLPSYPKPELRPAGVLSPV